jgi:NAD(P)-dependent dehydrogenase (short-subunit alcohol dehydrogenase family)
MKAPLRDVEGKTAFITGGANGIGLGMAKVFHRAGMKVVIADIRQDAIDAALHQLSDPKRVHGVRLDVMDRAAMVRAADETERVFGKVHLVCSNAGVNFFAPIDQCTYDDWDWILGVNLGGVVNGVQTFIPRIKAHGEGGHIVNTASMASFIAGAIAGIYTAAKFAVRGLSESLRWALRPHNIGVSVLCPGLVNSAINRSDEIRPAALSKNIGHVDAEVMKGLGEVQRLGMDPLEVAEKVLASVKRNDFYIFPHPEFKDELRAIFDEVLAALPKGEADPKRLAFEESRRRMMAKARAEQN